KTVPGDVASANRLAEIEPACRFRFWITGPAEDGYEDELARALAASSIPWTVGRADTAADGYAAADVVLFPSTWEGFGNPVIESVAHRKPIVVGHYPVLDELLGFGIELLSVDDPEAVAAWLTRPRPDVLERNVERVRPYCSLADLPKRLGAAMERAGWSP